VIRHLRVTLVHDIEGERKSFITGQQGKEKTKTILDVKYDSDLI